MSARDLILTAFDLSEMVTKSYIKDLTTADLLIRAVPGQNHIAWQLGHLLLSERNMIEGIKPGSMPELPPGFEEGHGRDKSNLDDPSLYRSTEEYFALMDAQRIAVKALLASLDDEALGAPSAEGMRQMAPTVAAVFLLDGNHFLMHSGQYVSVRRKLGKPIAF